MTYLNVRISEYTNRVLGVIKEKYGLKDKGQALDKFAEIAGEDYVEPEVRDELVEQIMKETDAHIKKYGFRKMSLADLHKLSGSK